MPRIRTSARGKSCRPTCHCVSADLWMEANGLFDLQVWLWGKDIQHGDGNGLIRYGFDRHPPPEGSDAASIYRLSLRGGRRVTLRGFGLFFSDRTLGGLFMQRYAFQPQCTQALDLPADAWSSPMLEDLRVPEGKAEHRNSLSLLRQAVRWMANYERWAWKALGRTHRQRAVAKWRDSGKPVVPAGQLHRAWRQWLAKGVDGSNIFACGRELA